MFEREGLLHGDARHRPHGHGQPSRPRHAVVGLGAETRFAHVGDKGAEQHHAAQAVADGEKEAQQEEGRVIEAIDIYRYEMKMSDEAIITKIMKKFSLSLDEAKSYVCADSVRAAR
jgi:hypothetical protein